MAETWAYKATKARVSANDTERVLDLGFICRSSSTSNGRWPANVRQVGLGDVIHFVYVCDGKIEHLFGQYEVIAPDQHEDPTLFGGHISTSALYVANRSGKLHSLLASLAGYAPDRRIGVDGYPGWVVRRVGGTTEDVLDAFPPHAQATLRRLG